MITDNLYRLLKPLPGLGGVCRRVVRHLPHRQRRVEHFGQRLWIDPSELHGFYLYYEREYDDWIFEFLARTLSSYSRALDIGANIGIYSVFLASNIQRVDAFEPDRAVLPGLRANLILNTLNNVAVHEVCIGKYTGTVRFLSSSLSNRGLGSITSDVTAGVVLSSLSLDDFFGGPVKEPTFIKIDIEGGEWLALQGCTESLGRRNAPVDILLELHPDAIRTLGGTPVRLRLILEELGFTVSALTPGGLYPLDLDVVQRFWWASGDKRMATADGGI